VAAKKIREAIIDVDLQVTSAYQLKTNLMSDRFSRTICSNGDAQRASSVSVVNGDVGAAFCLIV
jgi:hypothetical protein